ncbi:MFS transporter [Pseudomonas sp. MSSRFD41]|uniref:MFS transporter n=1 Tax=unclassified Pseudomonas TaxID=196821 RepID=UPI00163A1946|nr:MFS transporter [Pseudomonas sp. MSSRFD41]MBC2658157.1 MFS transporter [Pseudomonas sp. MSSRFD41]
MRASSIDPAAAVASQAGDFPSGRLLLLCMASFLAEANLTFPAGLLPQLAADFGISQAGAGQWVTFCSLGAGLAAIPLSAATRGCNQRRVLLAVLAVFCIASLVSAGSSNLWLTLAVRLLVGLATGLAWSLLATYARSLVAVPQQGRALALAMFGIPLALSLGVPLASWASELLGWRAVFAVLGGLDLLLMLGIARGLPDRVGEARKTPASFRQVLSTPGVGAVLGVVTGWILAHYILYTYLSAYLQSLGMASQLGQLLFVFGLAALVGVWAVGLLVDRCLRVLVLLSLSAFCLVALLLGSGGLSLPMVYLVMVIWGLSFSGAPTLLQTALADAAAEHATAAQSMLVTVFNLAFAGSGALGGVLLQTTGVRVFPWVILALLAGTLGLAWSSRRHAFRPGRRRTH